MLQNNRYKNYDNTNTNTLLNAWKEIIDSNYIMHYKIITIAKLLQINNEQKS